MNATDKINKINKTDKIAVLMGGNSAERMISLKSGQAVLAALQRCGVNAVGIDTATQLHQIIEQEITKVFIALHGRGGEDGSIQGYLDTLAIPYTGSKVTASALAMNKQLTKYIWQAVGLPTPAMLMLQPPLDTAQIIAQLGLPLMVKPILEGSSVGMTKVNSATELQTAWKLAAEYNCPIMAEKFVTGMEYTVAILHNKALPLIRLHTPRDFYDFAAKYTENTTQYICPCGLPSAEELKLQQLALQAFQVIGASGWGRVDLICSQDGQAHLLEINTVPGLTDHSLVPMAALVAGLDFDNLVMQILATA